LNVIYRLLEKSAYVNNVEYNQKIHIKVDLAFAHDGSMTKIINEARLVGDKRKLPYGDRLHVTIDHFLPAPSSEARDEFIEIKEFCEKNDIKLYAHGEGVLHQVVAENFGDRLINKIIVGVDGHICTSAAFGALTFSIDPQEMINVLRTGKFECIVPRIIKVQLSGELQAKDDKCKGKVSGKDIALYILSKLGKALKGKGVVFYGKSLVQLTQSQKMTIANMMGEVGVRTCYFMEGEPDKDEIYDESFNLSIDKLIPLVALPGSPEYASAVEAVKGIPITQVYIGGCTNGRIDDMKIVSDTLENRKVHKNVTLIISPASRKIANEMDQLGYSEIIRNSGGIIINPGCGACSGIHQGVLSRRDVIITTTVRNTRGRMGDEDAKIYLASPQIAAISALLGELANSIE